MRGGLSWQVEYEITLEGARKKVGLEDSTGHLDRFQGMKIPSHTTQESTALEPYGPLQSPPSLP
jgi:hypothetical protein